MSLELPFSIKLVNPAHVDAYYGPHVDLPTALLALPSAIRYQGQTVAIIVSGTVKEYWFKDGIADINLIEKILTGGTGIISSFGKGIQAIATSGDNQLASAFAFPENPLDKAYISITINGLEYEIGDANKLKAFYISGDSGVTARSFDGANPNGKVQIGDQIYFNGAIVGHDLDTSDTININYQI